MPLKIPRLSPPILLALALAIPAMPASAMEIVQQGTALTVTGSNFRYTWDTRRGGELASVEQPGTSLGGWWNKGSAEVPTSNWQRVNSTFAWKSLDTIPSLSFSTKRAAYYSGEWNVAYANADRHATLKILKQSPEELDFETQSNPRILENVRLPIPWKVTQHVQVFDSGIIVTRFDITLPKDETYELDWASMSVNLDDSLYKEPHPDRQEKFAFSYAFPEGQEIFTDTWKPVLQDLPHLPLDIDIQIPKATLTEKPILFGAAAYDLTHIKGSAENGFAEWCLEDARSLVGTKGDFGSYLMIRPQSGMSPVPTYAGSPRSNPCLSAGWNLFDGKTQGLNEPLTYHNTLTFAVGGRKHSASPTAGADDRNLLLGSRVYYARDKMPAATDIQAMAADGCDTLLLGPAWRTDENATKAVVQAAHAAHIRVAPTVNARDLKMLVTSSDWFTRVFEKDRDGIVLSNVSFLANAQAPDDFTPPLLDGQPISFRKDGPNRANAAAFALCMRTLRQTVGARGFLIGQDAAPGPTLLSFAECDAHIPSNPDAYDTGTPEEQVAMRNRCGAGLAPVVDSLTPADIAAAAMHADTPVILWPAKDQQHLAWWKITSKLPANGFSVQSDLLPAERQFTTSSSSVHGTLFLGAAGKGMLLLSADKAGPANVTFTIAGVTVTTEDGKPVSVAANGFDAGQFAANQVKQFQITAPKESAK